MRAQTSLRGERRGAMGDTIASAWEARTSVAGERDTAAVGQCPATAKVQGIDVLGQASPSGTRGCGT
jgi:hypothetical protein